MHSGICIFFCLSISFPNDFLQIEHGFLMLIYLGTPLNARTVASVDHFFL